MSLLLHAAALSDQWAVEFWFGLFIDLLLVVHWNSPLECTSSDFLMTHPRHLSMDQDQLVSWISNLPEVGQQMEYLKEISNSIFKFTWVYACGSNAVLFNTIYLCLVKNSTVDACYLEMIWKDIHYLLSQLLHTQVHEWFQTDQWCS